MTRAVTKRDIQHLYRRAAFGSPPDEAYQLAGQSVDALVNLLMTWRDDSQIAALANAYRRDETTTYGAVYESIYGVFNSLYFLLAGSPNQFHERLAMVGLHDRLSTSYSAVGGYGAQDYAAQMAAEHIDRLRAAGRSMNYRDLVLGMGEDLLMAKWLNIDGSERGTPNQNYARELMELFTLDTVNDQGQPNYTIDDIREIARAFTGWRVENGYLQGGPPGRWMHRIRFDSTKFDAGQKTIFAGTPWEGHVVTGRDVVNHIFDSHPNASVSLAKWMGREYIGPQVTREIIAELAYLIRQNNFNLRAAFERLLKSGYFYADAQQFAILKHPSEREVHLLRVMMRLGWFIQELDRSRSYYDGKDVGCHILWNFTVFGCDREKEMPLSGRLLNELRAQDQVLANSMRSDIYNLTREENNELIGNLLRNGSSIDQVLNYLSDLFGFELSAAQRTELTFWLNHYESTQLRLVDGQYVQENIIVDSPWDPTVVQGPQGPYYRDGWMLTKARKAVLMMSQMPQVVDVH